MLISDSDNKQNQQVPAIIVEYRHLHVYAFVKHH